MKKFGLLVLSLMGCSTLVVAQQNWCGSDAHLEKTFAENPERIDAFVEQYTRIANGQIMPQDRTDPIIIPVVVHVLHDNGIGNISYEQIVSGIDQLNEDYNRLNADSADTRNSVNAPFEPIAANVGIEFRLAKIDPNGNCTNGVERRNSPGVTYNAGEDAKYYSSGGLDAWDRHRYMNIWIVNSIESDGTGGITLGYAAFPQFATDGYGLLIRHDSYGTIGTGSGDRTLTHEIGHCLGLLHTFQGPFFGSGTGCHSSDCTSAGDFCCDTPPATAAHWDCPATYNSCTSVPSNDFYTFDAYDQWENYMSYAPCQNMFSEGQKAIILANLTDIAFLADLVSLSNQVATGVLNPEALCQAAFYSNVQTICAGSTINFFDDSYFNVTGWNWTFEGGTTSSTADQNPVVTYDTPGTYDVSLEVTDGVSNTSVTLTDYIIVLPDPGDILPYKEGFEFLPGVPDNDRFFVQNGNGGSTWEITGDAAFGGSNCVYIQNFGVDDGSKDELISGTIDLSTVSSTDPMVFNFRYAYTRKTSADDEWLRFYISKDCGETWTVRKNLHGSTLGEEISSTAFVPDSQEDWTMVSVTNITSDYYVSDFRFKFEFENDGGNNIYLDHINMYPASMTGMTAEAAETRLSIFPNPASGTLHITFVVSEQSDYMLSVYDMVGNRIAVIPTGLLGPGEHTIEYDLSNLAAGVYVIKAESEATSSTIQFIRE